MLPIKIPNKTQIPTAIPPHSICPKNNSAIITIAPHIIPIIIPFMTLLIATPSYFFTIILLYFYLCLVIIGTFCNNITKEPYSPIQTID